MNLKRYFIFTILGLFILVGIFFSGTISLITDWWWFSEVQFTEIFLVSLKAQLLIGVIAMLVSFLFLALNYYIASHAKIPWFATLPASLVGQPVSVTNRLVTGVFLAFSLLLAILTGLYMASSWSSILQFLASTPFTIRDSLLGKDIGFYVFELPVYRELLGVAKMLTTVSLIGVILISLLRRSLNFGEIFHTLTRNSARKTASVADNKTHTHARIQLGILVSLYLVITAATTYLSIYQLLITQNGPVFGAAFTDATILIPILRASIVAYLIAAFFAFIYGISGKIIPLLVSFGLTIIIGLVAILVPIVVQRIIVAPNELVKETPYIMKNITATRDAYQLNAIEKRTISADQPLTAEDLAQNNLTIKNVRLWDRDPLLSTFSQIQEIRTYYEFASVDNDRYMLNGELREVMLSPRELQSDSLPNKNWINERLTFTHGYGIAAGPVNQVTPEGLPVLFVKNLPPVTDVKELQVNRPEIYFGEISNSYVIVNSNSKEFDYPKGDQNVYSNYAGTGGITLNSFVKRLFYAIQHNEPKMLLSGDITDRSRILYHRNVLERVEKIAPFLSFDQDPYLVVADGKLYWILDAYTQTANYPYSEPVDTAHGELNYMRNSVKAVVDAYNGSVQLYLADPSDPIIRTYEKIFPATFRSMSQMPKALVPHLRYPEDIFSIQTAIYSTYHMDDPQIFYNKEDQWEIPGMAQVSGQVSTTENTDTPMSPRHMIMKLPHEDKEEFILMIPFTPRAKDNLSAWMVARNDGDHYGKLVVYSFPKDKLVFGPKQIIGRINQDAEVSRQIALWDQRGSQVIQGSLLVIPIEESLVYVRPLYLKAESGKIPELKRVIVAYENKIAMEETLEEGLGRIFGTSTDSPVQTTESKPASGSGEVSTPSDASNGAQSEQMREAYENAIEAQKNGDWATYGKEIDTLGELIKQLQ